MTEKKGIKSQGRRAEKIEMHRRALQRPSTTVPMVLVGKARIEQRRDRT